MRGTRTRVRRGPVRMYCSKRCENRHYYKTVMLPKCRKKTQDT